VALAALSASPACSWPPFGQPLTRISRPSIDHVVIDDSGVALRLGSQPLRMEPPLDDLIVALAARSGAYRTRWLLPGTAGPVSPKTRASRRWLTLKSRTVSPQRTLARGRVEQLQQARASLDADELRSTLTQLGGLVGALKTADPGLRAEFYGAVQLEATYHPDQHTLAITAAPPVGVRYVSEGGLEPPRPCGH
jgi:hypothetical protein